MLGCWVRLGLRNRLLRIHMLKSAKLGCRQYLGIQCVCCGIKSIHIYMGSFITEFSDMTIGRINFSAISSTKFENPVIYWGISGVYKCTFRKSYLSESFKFHDNIIKELDILPFYSQYILSLLVCVLDNISLLTYVRN
jgi:hypothetical protein